MLLFFGFFLLFPESFQAEGKNEPTYTVKPLLSVKQLEEVTDYFHVRITPKEKQTLQVEIQNNTEDMLTFSAEIENAITNDHGVIEYQHELKKYDETLKYKLTGLAKVQEAIDVPAKSIGILDIAVTAPEKEFDGIVLGGVRISEKKAEIENGKSGISNTFSYVIPIKLYETDVAIPNKLNFHGTEVGKQSSKNMILAKLQNPQPEILRELNIEAKVFEKGSKQPVFEEKKENMKLAPNSNFSYAIPIGTNRFKAGKYRLELTAVATDLSEKWIEEFEITSKKAQEMNDQIVFKKKTNLSLYALLGALVLALGVIGYLLYRQHIQKQVANMPMEPKKMKKRRKVKKKRSTELLLLVLAASSLLIPNAASAESTFNSDVSEATIIIKQKPKESKITTSEPSKSKSKTLPKTSESAGQNQLVVLAGWVVIVSSTVLLRKQKERGHEYEN